MKEVDVEEFFVKRFKRKPEFDTEYFKEWKERFAKGNPERWMDKKSRKVYNELKKGI